MERNSLHLCLVLLLGPHVLSQLQSLSQDIR
jgi:hypothetical protein